MPNRGYGLRITEARRHKGWTQGELAQACGTYQGTVSNWENEINAPQGRSWDKLARMLEASGEWLKYGGGMKEAIRESSPGTYQARADQVREITQDEYNALMKRRRQ